MREALFFICVLLALGFGVLGSNFHVFLVSNIAPGLSARLSADEDLVRTSLQSTLERSAGIRGFLWGFPWAVFAYVLWKRCRRPWVIVDCAPDGTEIKEPPHRVPLLLFCMIGALLYAFTGFVFPYTLADAVAPELARRTGTDADLVRMSVETICEGLSVRWAILQSVPWLIAMGCLWRDTNEPGEMLVAVPEDHS